MTIGIDCRFASLNVGLGRYTRELVTELLNVESDIAWILFVRSASEGWLHPLPVSRYSLVATRFSHYSLSEQLLFPRVMKQSGIDLLFSPHFNVPLLCPVPFVVTIHDLILHRYRSEASPFKQAAYRLVMRNAVTRAQKIIAVSQFTAHEIAQVYGRGVQSKITVIPEGVDKRFHPRSLQEQQSVRLRFNLDRDFFLYVGNAKKHKNVQMLIDSFEDAGLQDSDLVLVTGGKEVKQLRLAPGIRIIESVYDDDLAALYSAARAFVTASLYEGFCLTILEAQACGCPVIASNRTAIQEVAGRRAMLVEPQNASLREAFSSPPDTDRSPERVPEWTRAAKHVLATITEGILSLDGSHSDPPPEGSQEAWPH